MGTYLTTKAINYVRSTHGGRLLAPRRVSNMCQSEPNPEPNPWFDGWSDPCISHPGDSFLITPVRILGSKGHSLHTRRGTARSRSGTSKKIWHILDSTLHFYFVGLNMWAFENETYKVWMKWRQHEYVVRASFNQSSVWKGSVTCTTLKQHLIIWSRFSFVILSENMTIQRVLTIQSLEIWSTVWTLFLLDMASMYLCNL